MRALDPRTLSAVLLLLTSVGAGADDTDIYLNPERPIGGEPLVMFTLDYRPNLASSACQDLRRDASGAWTGTCASIGDYLPSSGPYSFFDVLRAVFEKVLEPLAGVKVGFMLNHAHQNNCAGPTANNCSNGGYVLMGFESLQVLGDNRDVTGAKARLQEKLAAIPLPQGNVSHSYQGKELFFELFRYLTGQGVYNGHNGWTDFGTDSRKNLDNPADGAHAPEAAWDTGIEELAGTTTRYRSPLEGALDCVRVFTINLMFEVSNQESDSDDAIVMARAEGGMGGISTRTISSNSGFAGVVRYLYDTDLADGSYNLAVNIDGRQNVTSYFLIDETFINQTTTEYAVAGGTGTPLALSEDPDELIATLNGILKSILSVSTTFVAPTVPVNVFNRTETENEVYLALFQAEEGPLWPGNLKKLRIATNPLTGAREIQDANGLQAIDIDGRIKREALSVWTDAMTLPLPGEDEVAGKDGRAVARGGAGQQIPGFVPGPVSAANGTGTRQLFTEAPSEGTAEDRLMALNADDSSADTLWPYIVAEWDPPAATSRASATTAERTRALGVLRFARGLQDSGTSNRLYKPGVPWMLGDPLHSRPRALNYGARATGYTTDNPDIRILVGTNDGFLHMIRNRDATGAEDGSERWAFMPREVLAKLTRLHDNAVGMPMHPVTVDGSPATLVIDQNFDGNLIPSDGDRAYVYFGLRRGGKSYYALEVTNPDAPRFLWSITKGASGTSFAELAQSWSVPRVGYVRLDSSPLVAPVPILIFGGGYNGDDAGNLGPDDAAAGKDRQNRATRAAVAPVVGSDDDEGNAVFIVNALNGNLIRKFTHADLRDSVPADVAALDTDGDFLIDRIYFGDTGGVLWRIDLAGPDATGAIVRHEPARWQITRLLSVGRHAHGSDSIATDRRFFNRPDVVQSRDDTGPFDGVLIGSGDREDPNGELVQDWFYLYKDRHVTSGVPPTEPLTDEDLADLTDIPDLTEDCLAAENCTAPEGLTNGWRIRLTHAGEKNLAPALTLGGRVFFTTFAPEPPEGQCSLSEGAGRLYAVGLQTAEALFNWDTTNDLADQDTLERSDRLGSGGIPVEPVPLGGGDVLFQGQEPGQNIMPFADRMTYRSYWHEHYE
jgi:type IV pilus assembly protein PilY1